MLKITQQATASESYAAAVLTYRVESETGFLVDKQKAETMHSSMNCWGGFML